MSQGHIFDIDYFVICPGYPVSGTPWNKKSSSLVFNILHDQYIKEVDFEHLN